MIRNFGEYKEIRIKLKDIKIQQKKMKQLLDENENKDFKDYNIEYCASLLEKKICEIYPKTKINISIVLINDVVKSNPLESKVFTWFSYPDQNQNDKTVYTIKNNTDFNLIVENNTDYFFVSDLKEFNALESYKNENECYLQKYNTSIVCPIRKKGRDKRYDMLGFLCVNSPQKLNNTKKNDIVVNYVKAAASVIYDFLNQNKDKQEILSIKQ
jgi:hypothetical protein